LAIFVITFGWVQQQSNSKATPNPPKSDDKNGQEMFNWSELHSERSNLLQNPYFSKNQFLKNLCSGTQCGGFQFLLILDLWGKAFMLW
jgi:hypothetical protein